MCIGKFCFDTKERHERKAGVKLMRNNRNTRINDKRIERRKRRQLWRFLFSLMIVVVLIMLAFHIRDIKAQIKEMQALLYEMETKQNKTEEKEAVLQKEASYASSIDVINVEKPIQRTLAEAIEKLNEWGKTNPVIDEISKKSSLYPEDLLLALANNPEMADFVSGYLSENGDLASSLTKQEKEQDFPLFLQWDPRWGYQSYGKDSCVGLSGCGPTCLSMVLYYLTRDEMFTPDRIASYSVDNGYYVEGIGTEWIFMKDYPQLYGIEVTELSAIETTLKEELDKGSILICALGEGDFTVSGHFIVIYGYEEGKFRINDPNCVARSNRGWSFSEIKKQIKSIWAYKK